MKKRDLYLTTIGFQRDDTESVRTFDHVSCIVRSCKLDVPQQLHSVLATNMHIIIVPIQETNYENKRHPFYHIPITKLTEKGSPIACGASESWALR